MAARKAIGNEVERGRIGAQIGTNSCSNSTYANTTRECARTRAAPAF